MHFTLVTIIQHPSSLQFFLIIPSFKLLSYLISKFSIFHDVYLINTYFYTLLIFLLISLLVLLVIFYKRCLGFHCLSLVSQNLQFCKTRGCVLDYLHDIYGINNCTSRNTNNIGHSRRSMKTANYWS